MPDQDLVVVFPTAHLTLKAESLLEKAGVRHRTVMKPRRISSDCGLAIRIDPGDLQRIRKLLEESNTDPVGFFMESGGSWEPVSRQEDG
ncbi:MAG: DUF3343 domain-containing protein [bacterium]|nr:DUF3343 domain-containing protein [bacterium]